MKRYNAWYTRITERFTFLSFDNQHTFFFKMLGVSGDKIDDDDYIYHDSTDSKMWQGSLPHKKIKCTL